ncbi:oxygen-dependent protoporphyrinogen oxidase [Arthrobacter sp. V4I6]|uniref:protoporphyrinogen oxidase n=1 Tax=unclassified Arthrobacter TaxID=235627 RepID=UPI00278AA19D|nr:MULTISPECIES: protoporphyrinogen oxidase [unclassified Arthrobacter]MDQ0820146.1 oxygen-dependent protoporphyrinogen oxidase [Arthrobacter sp. V1I7]MDQ0854328.1 oxygen-dependent protoporphyrinogen oxidase [Arthrobacter sp. V4I6]
MGAAERGRGLTAVVVGGGISGLLAARELACAGVSTTVLEASKEWGGCVGSHVVGGLTLDSGAESFATRSSAVADLAAELGLAAEIVAPDPGGAWVQLPDGPRELPRTGVLGIPANPWDPEVRRSLGMLGSLRASLDALLPASLGTGSGDTSVSALVRARMGRRVLERLVAPVVGGVHSADPAVLDVDMVAPGLRAGIRQHGSLAAAVAAQRRGTPGAEPGNSSAGAGAAKPALQKAGSAVAGLRGGMHTLISALVADLRERGVTLLPSTRADTIERTAAGWRVRSGDLAYDAGLLVVAVEGPAAVGLLSGALPELASRRPAAGPDVSLVTLVVDQPELDSAPRGTGILVAPQSPGIAAKALTHATAKWRWLAGQTAPGTHVLRLSYGRGTRPADGSATDPRTDAELFDTALQDASALLAVPVRPGAVLAWDVVRWSGALPFASLGHKRRVADVQEICAADGTLAVVGGWLSGNGLAAIVADTPKVLRTLLP